MPPERVKDLFQKVRDAVNDALPMRHESSTVEKLGKKSFAGKAGTWSSIVAEKLAEKEDEEEDRRRKLPRDVSKQNPDKQS